MEAHEGHRAEPREHGHPNEVRPVFRGDAVGQPGQICEHHDEPQPKEVGLMARHDGEQRAE